MQINWQKNLQQMFRFSDAKKRDVSSQDVAISHSLEVTNYWQFQRGKNNIKVKLAGTTSATLYTVHSNFF